MTTSEKRSLLDLPGEIRNRIYGCIFTNLSFSNQASKFIDESDPSIRRSSLCSCNSSYSDFQPYQSIYPSILQCNRQACTEASAFLHSRNINFTISREDTVGFTDLPQLSPNFPYGSFEQVQFKICLEAPDVYEREAYNAVQVGLYAVCYHLAKSKQRIRDLRIMIYSAYTKESQPSDTAPSEITLALHVAVVRACCFQPLCLLDVEKCSISLPSWADGNADLQQLARKLEQYLVDSRRVPSLYIPF